MIARVVSFPIPDLLCNGAFWAGFGSGIVLVVALVWLVTRGGPYSF